MIPLDKPFDRLSPENKLRVELTELIKSEASKVGSGISELEKRKLEVGTVTKSPRPRSSPNIARAREDIQKEINKRQVILDILEGRQLGEIVVRYENDEPAEVRIEQLDNADGYFWNQVERENGLVKLLDTKAETFRRIKSGVTLRIRSLDDPVYEREYFEAIDELETDEIADEWVVKLLQRRR